MTHNDNNDDNDDNDDNGNDTRTQIEDDESYKYILEMV